MKLTSQQYAQALMEVIGETNPKDHDKVLENFVRILAQNGDLGKHEEIEREFRKLKLSGEGIKEAEVTLAKEVEINHTIVNELNQAVGGKLEIRKKVDESLIGGVVVRVDDTLIDASIKTQLNKLNQSLKS
ncbi:MAG: ATP synthase F1 subunit delta [Patescibacteria group bacterium]|nr:ATP synthase F1 subunit delta [Patescibacteria group bacterium]